MKQILFLSLLFISVDAFAQSASNTSDLLVLDARWSLATAPGPRMMLETDPFGPGVEARNLLKARSENLRQNEVRQQMGLPPGLPPVSVAKAPMVRTPSSIFSSASYKYEIKVKNNGTRKITLVEWDYIFVDGKSDQEVGRVAFASRASIRPLKTKRLSMKSTLPPSRTISVEALRKPQGDQYRGTVEIKKLVYSDGSVWKADSK